MSSVDGDHPEISVFARKPNSLSRDGYSMLASRPRLDGCATTVHERITRSPHDLRSRRGDPVPSAIRRSTGWGPWGRPIVHDAMLNSLSVLLDVRSSASLGSSWRPAFDIFIHARTYRRPIHTCLGVALRAFAADSGFPKSSPDDDEKWARSLYLRSGLQLVVFPCTSWDARYARGSTTTPTTRT